MATRTRSQLRNRLDLFEKQIRFAGTKLTLVQDFSARFFNSPYRNIDFFGIDQAKTEMRNAARFPDPRRAFIEHNDVARAGRLRLDPPVLIVHFDHTEDFR